MAKLVAISLQKFSPIVSEYTKEEITSDGTISKITKSSCMLHFAMLEPTHKQPAINQQNPRKYTTTALYYIYQGYAIKIRLSPIDKIH